MTLVSGLFFREDQSCLKSGENRTSHLVQPTEHEELCKAMRTLASKKKGKRNETLEIPETVNADDVRKMLGYETGPEPVDEDEINQFLADIGFPNDKFCKIDDFAKFLLDDK